MSYIQKSLSSGEEIKHSFKLHWFVWFAVYIFCLIWLLIAYNFYTIEDEGSGIFSLLFVVIAIWQFLHHYNLEFAVTSKRVIFKKGIISRKTEEHLLDKIETVTVNQGIFGRIFGYGTVVVTGTGTSSTKLKDLDNPLKVKRSIEELI